MNINEIPTPETNAAIELGTVDPWDLAADLERRLTLANRLIKLISEQKLPSEMEDPESGDYEDAYTAIIKDARETLLLTAPKL